MQRLREYDREYLRHICEHRLPWQDGVVSLADVWDVLPACGLEPRNGDERHEVEAVINEFDEDGLGIVSCAECINILQVLQRMFRLMQNEKERQFVVAAGWTESHFAEFRNSFWNFDEDMSEVLERDELIKAIELLGGVYWQSMSNMNLMLVALGIDPSKEIQVNFLAFLRML